MRIQLKSTIMKYNSIIITAFFGLTFFVSSCSKCYECTREIEIQSGGQTIAVEEDIDEFCTTDDSEVDSRREVGEDCVPV